MTNEAQPFRLFLSEGEGCREEKAIYSVFSGMVGDEGQVESKAITRKREGSDRPRMQKRKEEEGDQK